MADFPSQILIIILKKKIDFKVYEGLLLLMASYYKKKTKKKLFTYISSGNFAANCKRFFFKKIKMILELVVIVY